MIYLFKVFVNWFLLFLEFELCKDLFCFVFFFIYTLGKVCPLWWQMLVNNFFLFSERCRYSNESHSCPSKAGRLSTNLCECRYRQVPTWFNNYLGCSGWQLLWVSSEAVATEWENRKLVRECIYTVLHSVGLGIIILFSFMFVFVFLLVFMGVLFLFG